jgi:hypothetical protein
MATITKTEYTYICSKGSDMADIAVLISTNDTLTLWINSLGISVQTIDEAEVILKEKFHEVMLETKTDYLITRLERIVQ